MRRRLWSIYQGAIVDRRVSVKTQELIDALLIVVQERGNVDVILASDSEGNAFSHLEDMSVFDGDEDMPAMLCLWPADGTIDV